MTTHIPKYAYQSRAHLVAAFDVLCTSPVPGFEVEWSGVDTQVIFMRLRGRLEAVLPDLVKMPSQAEALVAPVVNEEIEHLRGMGADPEFGAVVTRELRTRMTLLFFEPRIGNFVDLFQTYMREHEVPKEGWSFGTLQHMDRRMGTFYTLMRSKFPDGEHHDVFERYVLPRFSAESAVRDFVAAYVRPVPKRRSELDFSRMSFEDIAALLASLPVHRSDPRCHRWGMGSLFEWKADDGERVGAAVHYLIRKMYPEDPPEAFARLVVPHLSKDLRSHFDHRDYGKTLSLFDDSTLEGREKVSAAFVDETGTPVARDVLHRRLHELMRKEGNRDAFEFLKVDFFDLALTVFPGCSDEVQEIIVRCLHLYRPERSSSLAAYVLSQIRRRHIGLFANIVFSRGSRICDSIDLSQAHFRDLYAGVRIVGNPRMNREVEVLHWMRACREEGMTHDEIDAEIERLFAEWEDRNYGPEDEVVLDEV